MRWAEAFSWMKLPISRSLQVCPLTMHSIPNTSHDSQIVLLINYTITFILISSVSCQIVMRRSCMIKVYNFSITSSLRLVKGLSERTSLLADVRSIFKWLYRYFMRVILMASSTKAHRIL